MRVIPQDNTQEGPFESLGSSIEDGFRSRREAIGALALLVQIRKRYRISLDELLVYIAVGLYNFHRHENVRSVRPAVQEELCRLTGLPIPILQRCLRSLMGHGLVLATGSGFMIRSASLWSATVQSVATVKATGPKEVDPFDGEILRRSVARRIRYRKYGLAIALPLAIGGIILALFALPGFELALR